MKFVYRAGFAALFFSASLVARESADNPRPMKAIDIIMPMPCEREMVFAKVEVTASSAGEFGDARVQLGSRRDDVGFSEGPREVYLAGGFNAGSPATRSFWIGRYEVNRSQWAALDETCGKVAKADLPAAGMTVIEAQAFAHRYTLWLHKNHPDKLPELDGALAFVRLPTEAEWEFSTRGGRKVSASEFRADRFPMSAGIERYAWFQHPQHSRGKLQEIGLLEPNPLGLHDVLGNVAEYVLDTYQLNKHGRLHGQSGGWVVKGGHVKVPREAMRSTWRREVIPYGKAGKRALRRAGLRLVISMPVERSAARLNALREAWKRLPRVVAAPEPATGGASVGAEPKTDPIEELKTLADAAPDAAFKHRLERLVDTLRANIRTRNDARDRAASSQLRTVALLAHRAHRRICDLGNLQLILEKNKDKPERIKKFQGPARRKHKQSIEALRDYQDGVVEYADGFPSAIISAQAKPAFERMKQAGATEFAAFVVPVYKHVVQVKQGFALKREQIVDDLLRIRRGGKFCERAKLTTQ
ncbi:MAG: SUMF1/EgtB/PvdO family nonheme iron enzyme [Gammaproteobacteria bacterium]|nr:SUMF1/EgtB/PvdO family nonheme iron enzyme [Gammaproteobacteria bacterium]